MLNPSARHPVASRVAFLVTVAAALAVVAAACGGGSSKSTATTTTPPTTAAAAAAAATGGGAGGRGLGTQLNAFRSCMAAQGEPLPTFAPRTTTTGGSGSTATPDTGASGGGGPGGGRFLFGGGGGGGGGAGLFLRGLDQSDPKVMAAYNACKSQIPAALIQAQQQRSQAMTAFISCMSDHGVTISTARPAAGSPPSTIDQSSTAYQTCKVLLPAGGAFGPGRTTTTTSAA